MQDEEKEKERERKKERMQSQKNGQSGTFPTWQVKREPLFEFTMSMLCVDYAMIRCLNDHLTALVTCSGGSDRCMMDT